MYALYPIGNENRELSALGFERTRLRRLRLSPQYPSCSSRTFKSRRRVAIVLLSNGCLAGCSNFADIGSLRAAHQIGTFPIVFPTPHPPPLLLLLLLLEVLAEHLRPCSFSLVRVGRLGECASVWKIGHRLTSCPSGSCSSWARIEASVLSIDETVRRSAARFTRLRLPPPMFVPRSVPCDST